MRIPSSAKQGHPASPYLLWSFEEKQDADGKSSMREMKLPCRAKRTPDGSAHPRRSPSQGLTSTRAKAPTYASARGSAGAPA